MNKELKKKIYEAGQNDTYVEDILLESAETWINKNTDLEIDIYRDGFMGK